MQERRKGEESGLNVVFRQQCFEILIRLGGLRLGGNFEVGVRRAARVACNGMWIQLAGLRTFRMHSDF